MNSILKIKFKNWSYKIYKTNYKMFSSWFSKENVEENDDVDVEESDNESVEEDFLNCMMYEGTTNNTVGVNGVPQRVSTCCYERYGMN